MAQPHDEAEEEYLTATEAAHELGTTRAKMAALLKSGTLPFIDDPLDRRVRLIPRSAIEELRRLSGRRAGDPKARARRMGKRAA